jgi:hypothetical protein
MHVTVFIFPNKTFTVLIIFAVMYPFIRNRMIDEPTNEAMFKVVSLFIILLASLYLLVNY